MKKIFLASSLLLSLYACNQQKNIESQKNIDNTNTMTAEKQYFSAETNQEILTTVENQQISFEEIIKQQNGKLTLLEVWASWCPDCIKGFPKLYSLQKQYPNLNFVFISLDKTPEDWKQAIEKYNLKGNHFYIQQKMKDSFGTSISLDWIPRYILIGENGNIINFKAITADEENLLKDINIHYKQ